MSGRQQVCKFFKQGNCHYGDNCRFYHPKQGGFGNSSNAFGGNNNPFGNSGFSGNTAGNSTNMVDGRVVNTTETSETISQFCDAKTIGRRETEMRNDLMELSDNISASNHFFTSYSLKPPATVNILSGRDFSFEENRLAYYTAKATNTLPQYELQMKNRWDDMKSSVNHLKNNTQTAVRYLQYAAQPNNSVVTKLFVPVKDYNAPSTTTQNTIFGSTSSNNNPFAASSGIFGNSSGPSGAFSTQISSLGISSNQPSNASNPFGASSGSAFGKTGFGNTGSFGNGAFGQSGASNSVANSTATSNPFGASGGATSNPFGASSASTSNPFGAQTNAASVQNKNISSPFGSSGFGSSGFGSSGFGSSGFGSSGFGSSSFGNTPNNSNTGPSNNANSSPFGAVSSPFGNTSVSSNPTPFGATALAPSNIPFGSNSTAASSPFGNSPFQANSTNGFQKTVGYKQCDVPLETTKLQDLHADIVNLFKKEAFEMGQVPDIPPPIELC